LKNDLNASLSISVGMSHVRYATSILRFAEAGSFFPAAQTAAWVSYDRDDQDQDQVFHQEKQAE